MANFHSVDHSMSVFAFGMIFLTSFLEDQSPNLLKKKTDLSPCNIFCDEKCHCKRERMEIIDLHLTRVYAG